ncbi:hypothetical protein FBU59_001071 [Linderina macrospora]|uniref:Uncharacterized protein n=1 Tax=Linderina macrospora TaxID=4868 RepID=A0ACC1JF19_9FUNG|nr:hypothetical protein FBU59_001071 [Linderina macrospora]
MLSPNVDKFLACHINMVDMCKGRQRIGAAMTQLGFGQYSLRQFRWLFFRGDGVATMGLGKDHLQNAADMNYNLSTFIRNLPGITCIKYRRDRSGVAEASRSYHFLAGKARLVQETFSLYLPQLTDLEGFLPMLEVLYRDTWPYKLRFPKLWYLFVRHSTCRYFDLYSAFHGQPLTILDIHEPIEGFANIDPEIIRYTKAFALRSLTDDALGDIRYPEDTMKRFYEIESVVGLAFIAGVPAPFPVSLPWSELHELKITTEVASPMKIAILARNVPSLKKLDISCQSMDPDNFDSNFWKPNDATLKIYQHAGAPDSCSLARANSDPDILSGLTKSQISVLRVNMAGKFNGNAVSAVVSRLASLRSLVIHPRAVPVFKNYFALRNAKVDVIPYVIDPLLPP